MPPRDAWSDSHDEILLRAVISLILANRRNLYATPGLEGVGDHGGERINKKIQGFARRMAGEKAGMVGEELGKMVRKRKEDVKEETGEVEGGTAKVKQERNKKRKL
ncbi:hypothetical protein CC85DRAFT_300897 [Cutaneotrichosporon oleaginosum]|uniref:Uncharacterized protein n=1 Tax=Cutaneotrichosporon oleaginosum TaxID=879819 RepID=A0A0J0XSC9_9TREE|nr:uncharacterized protein CC85DRAFT_300897 [Cutaneotrichosporon oleaginosum]KLT43976.1 hypothetical protein CC85DRAFT_300897 [Cutaneotrichosporon oleaginosum]TXT04076.1 hypothetical protein COLE_07773 [Cutaneotrichosporon oleaginosum]